MSALPEDGPAAVVVLRAAAVGQRDDVAVAIGVAGLGVVVDRAVVACRGVELGGEGRVSDVVGQVVEEAALPGSASVASGSTVTAIITSRPSSADRASVSTGGGGSR